MTLADVHPSPFSAQNVSDKVRNTIVEINVLNENCEVKLLLRVCFKLNKAFDTEIRSNTYNNYRSSMYMCITRMCSEGCGYR